MHRIRFFRTVVVLAVAIPSMSAADEGLNNAFFAFDNCVGRKQRTFEEQAKLIHEAGYDGIGYSGTQHIPEMLAALDKYGLKMFSIYVRVDVGPKGAKCDPGLPRAIEQLKGRGTVIWLYLIGGGEGAEEHAVALVREVGERAAKSGLRVATYPHTGFFVDTLDDSLRIAKKVNLANVGCSFNLCHWLKVDGQQSQLKAKLREAMPKLFLVSINGADAGDTRTMGWDRLIQPLDRGSYDVFALLKTLKSLGYDGPVGLQCYGIAGEPCENLRRSMKAWRDFQKRMAADNWYTRSFFLLHEDHHTTDRHEVGRDADPEQTARLVNLVRPDVLQIHAKGNPGWTTYPTRIGFTPPKLRRDVLQVWRDIADRYGYPFSIYYNIGRDGEIMRRHPEWNRSDGNGQEIDRALCYHSGVAEKYLWPMIREIMARYHPDGWWFDGSCFTVRLCYCERCRDRFRRETGVAPPRDRNDPNWSAYHAMQRQVYREFIQKTAAMIHKIDPYCLVAFNWAYSLRMPEKPDPGIAYLTGDIGNRVEGLSAAAHWYDGTGLPFDLMTQLNTQHAVQVPGGTRSRKGGGGAVAQSSFGPKPPVQLQQEMAIVVANGGRFWVWDNPTPESGLVAARYEYLARHVKPWLEQRRRWCLGSRRLPDVSLLHAAEAHYALTDPVGPVCFNARDSRIEGAADWLSQVHLNYEMVGDWRLHAQDVRSRVLIVEHPKRLENKTVAALGEFVRRGGTLLLTGMGVQAGGDALERLCGVAQVTAPESPEPLNLRCNGRELPCTLPLFRFRLDGAEPLMSVTDRRGRQQPLLVRHPVGQGTAYYLAAPLLTKSSRHQAPRSLVEAVFDVVIPPSHRLVTTTAPETVEIVLREQGQRRIVHLINRAPGKRRVFRGGRRKYVNIESLPEVPECVVKVRLERRPRSVMLQPQGTSPEDWKYRDSVVTVRVPSFRVHQMVVID